MNIFPSNFRATQFKLQLEFSVRITESSKKNQKNLKFFENHFSTRKLVTSQDLFDVFQSRAVGVYQPCNC